MDAILAFLISSVAAARVKFEQRALEHLSALLADFKSETGLSLERVSIRMVDATAYSQPVRMFVISGVDADVSWR